jgi:hypothetical protein
MVTQATTAVQDSQAVRATQADRAVQDPRDHQDHQAAPAVTDNPVYQAGQPPARRTRQAIRDNRVNPVQKAYQATQACQAAMASQATQDHQDPRAPPANQAIQARQATKDRPDHQDLPESAVSVRNTAHWMVASFSRMAREESRPPTVTDCVLKRPFVELNLYMIPSSMQHQILFFCLVHVFSNFLCREKFYFLYT